MKAMKVWDDCTRREKIARWENVARVLQALTRHQRRYHFDMCFFVQREECGTIACAAGHCGFDPWFKRRGYEVRFSKNGICLIRSVSGDSFCNGFTIEVESFFGSHGTNHIFYNTEQRPVSQVIREVRSYVKTLHKDKKEDEQ